jgi:hypothetical protein
MGKIRHIVIAFRRGSAARQNPGAPHGQHAHLVLQRLDLRLQRFEPCFHAKNAEWHQQKGQYVKQHRNRQE